MKRDGPYSISRGSAETGQFLLTHVEWHPNGQFGDIEQMETGVRFKQSDGTFGNFNLIEHGWRNFGEAEKVILMGLCKRWNINRISDVMEYLANRRLYPR